MTTRKQDAEYYKEKKDRGECYGCKNPSMPGKSFCKTCSGKSKARRAALREQGLCYDCGEPVEDRRRTRCRRCLDINNTSSKRYGGTKKGQKAQLRRLNKINSDETLKEKIRVRTDRVHRTLEGRFNKAIKDSELRQVAADKKGKDADYQWGLTYDQFCFLFSLRCYYCGTRWKSKTGYHLDRKDSDKAYTWENSVPCCSLCNRVKGKSLTFSQMLEVGKLVAEWRDSGEISAWAASDNDSEVPEVPCWYPLDPTGELEVLESLGSFDYTPRREAWWELVRHACPENYAIVDQGDRWVLLERHLVRKSDSVLEATVSPGGSITLRKIPPIEDVLVSSS